MNSYFYCSVEKNTKNAEIINAFEVYTKVYKQTIYIVNKPLGENKYHYKFNDGLIILMPKHKIGIINNSSSQDGFDDYIEDLIEDIGSISDKHNYKDVVGRTRKWRSEILEYDIGLENIDLNNIEEYLEKIELTDPSLIKKSELIVSLMIGSINDITRVKDEVPETLLDKVKQKIQLFDGDQTRFIYQRSSKKRIVIQGLSGTGKTELLLHKLKDLYTSDNNNRIFFTCHNRILADSLAKRIPNFFNFMKVEQQIEWNKRLWCTNSWGSKRDSNSGAYAYICSYYKIPVLKYNPGTTFSEVCDIAFKQITEIKDTNNDFQYALDYMLIDESQDFTQSFFNLCELVTKNTIFIAGDIFQSIFDEYFSKRIEPDYLLGKCYRTDPKTLMFSHALGMGLFEDFKLRWLDKKEWEDCGYNVSVNGNQYTLSREPLRRFEDIDDDFKSIQIVKTESSEKIPPYIINIIKKIMAENPTVKIDDIGIIFLDNSNNTYRLADLTEAYIKKFLSWDVNKSYETKVQTKGKLLISNRNNVKGLEFPFVICVTLNIHRGLSYRNALYTMLSRSFIKTYLVIPEKNSGLTENIQMGLNEIMKTKQMVITEPGPEEKKIIQTNFDYEKRELSKYDLIQEVMKEESIEVDKFEKIQGMLLNTNIEDQDKESIREFIIKTIDYI
ncbi:DEAD/DEAH box helicase [Sphingobacterium siyangense]|uniref:DEAD/DEAH box helicase n=1 Tax=Sphingobacterium siyangense TaxID=459529 RepID=UPI003DA5842D